MSELRRDASDRILLVKVLTTGKVLFQDGKYVITGEESVIHNLRMSEFVVGDSTGCVSFLARNEQGNIYSSFRFLVSVVLFIVFWSKILLCFQLTC